MSTIPRCVWPWRSFLQEQEQLLAECLWAWRPLNPPLNNPKTPDGPAHMGCLLTSSHTPHERAPSPATLSPPVRGRGAPPSLRPSHQRRPPLLRRLLQDLEQQVAEGLGDAAVAGRRQVEEVEHVLRDDGSVRVDQVPAHVQELGLLAQSRQPGAHQPVDGGVLLPQRVGTLASGQQTLQSRKPSI